MRYYIIVCLYHVEFSPSGDGVHLYFKGTKPKGSSKNSEKGVEIKNSLFKVWDTEKTGVANKVNGIKEKIVNGFKSAVDYVKGLITQARSWGSDLIQNIINGLHEKIQDLADGVTDVANTI